MNRAEGEVGFKNQSEVPASGRLRVDLKKEGKNKKMKNGYMEVVGQRYQSLGFSLLCGGTWDKPLLSSSL